MCGHLRSLWELSELLLSIVFGWAHPLYECSLMACIQWQVIISNTSVILHLHKAWQIRCNYLQTTGRDRRIKQDFPLCAPVRQTYNFKMRNKKRQEMLRSSILNKAKLLFGKRKSIVGCDKVMRGKQFAGSFHTCTCPHQWGNLMWF